MSTTPQDPSQPEARLEFWRRTPPALFPSLMGLFGLGLAWRAASDFGPFAITPWIGNVILLIACLLELFILSSYISKVSYRPSVVRDDMASVPGRAGVSAITISVILFAAALVPYSPTVASAALFIALPIHLFTTVLALAIMSRTEGGLVVSPAWHLSFVGLIVCCLVAVPLGYIGLAKVIFAITFLASLIIYAVSLIQMSKAEMLAPMRPMLVIHLAPLSLFATTAALLNAPKLSLFFAALAIGAAGVLLSAVRYLIASGFSPLWGAFTFPIAALSVALFSISASVSAFAWLALLPLILVSVLTPVILVRVLIMWASGALAIKTGAATA